MTIEETARIDVVARRPDGKLLLVVTDHLGWEEPERHKLSLRAKLDSYVGYIHSPLFSTKHPNVSPADVAIMVACQFPVDDTAAAALEELAQQLSRQGIELAFEHVEGAAPRPPVVAGPILTKLARRLHADGKPQ